MKSIFTLFCLCVLATLTAGAQTNFLDGLRKIEAGRGKIVVEQSHDIDKLVNGKLPETKPVTATSAGNSSAGTTSSAAGTSANGKPATPNAAATTTGSTSHNETTRPDTSGDDDLDPDAVTVVDTRKKVMRNSYKTTGYRIQIFSGGNSRADRQKAEAAGNAMKAHFPTEPIYVHFYSPSWKCRMGNYKDQAEAQRILAQVRALGYKNACIVKGTISVQY